MSALLLYYICKEESKYTFKKIMPEAAESMDEWLWCLDQYSFTNSSFTFSVHSTDKSPQTTVQSSSVFNFCFHACACEWSWWYTRRESFWCYRAKDDIDKLKQYLFYILINEEETTNVTNSLLFSHLQIMSWFALRIPLTFRACWKTYWGFFWKGQRK